MGFMEFLSAFLPIIIYMLLIIILIIGIILGIKSIITIEKIEKIVDDVTGKVQSLNGFFSIIDFTTDKIALLTDKTVDLISGIFSKIFYRKKDKEEVDIDE